MRLECPKKTLEDIIGKAEKITGKNLALPVLKCVLIESKEGMLVVRATNLDLGVEITVPVKAGATGRVAVPGGILSSFLSNLPDDSRVTLETEGENVRLKTPATSTIIKTLPHEDFPTIPVVDEGDHFVLDVGDFLKGLKSVAFSAAISSMKPELSSVYIYPQGEKELVFAATDSFRLAEKHISTAVPKGFKGILIPARNIPDLVRFFEGAKGELEVVSGQNQASFSFENVFVVSRVVDGVFPDYKQIVPQSYKTEAVVLKQDLADSLKLANIFSDKFNQLNIKVDPSDKTVQLTTRNSDVGEAVRTLDVSVTGESIDINVMQRYVSDSLQSIESDSIAMEFNGQGRPIVMRGTSDKSFMYLVMPMNR